MTIQEKFDLTGRTAIVTGGAGLLGKEFSKTLAEGGASVGVADLDGKAAEAVAKSLTDSGYRAISFALDVTRIESTRELASVTVKEFGGLDILVNSAALDPKFDPDAAGNEIRFGTANTDAVDITWYSDTSGSTVTFDEENVAVNFGASDTGVDVHFYGATASQQAWWDESGDEWFFGDDAEGVDVTFNGDNTGNYIKWDESLDTLVGVGGHIKLDDDAYIYLDHFRASHPGNMESKKMATCFFLHTLLFSKSYH